MAAIEIEKKLRRLALREGMTFASMIGLAAADRDVLTATILARFDPGSTYTEKQVNEILKGWLGGAGSMLETDHATLRRWLIDTKLMSRTDDCAQYRLDASGIEARAPLGEFEALDADAIVIGARTADLERRAARKAAWLKQGAG